MNTRNCYQVIIKNSRGKVVKNWKTSLFRWVNIRIEGEKTIIEQRTFLGRTQTYITSMNESVEVRDLWWFFFQLISNLQ